MDEFCVEVDKKERRTIQLISFFFFVDVIVGRLSFEWGCLSSSVERYRCPAGHEDEMGERVGRGGREDEVRGEV